MLDLKFPKLFDETVLSLYSDFLTWRKGKNIYVYISLVILSLSKLLLEIQSDLQTLYNGYENI